MARRPSELPPLPESKDLLPFLLSFIAEYRPTDRQMRIIAADRYGFKADEMDIPVVPGTKLRFSTRYNRAIGHLLSRQLVHRESRKPMYPSPIGEGLLGSGKPIFMGAIDLDYSDRAETKSTPLDAADTFDGSQNAEEIEPVQGIAEGAVEDGKSKARRLAGDVVSSLPGMRLSRMHVLWVNASRIAASNGDADLVAAAVRVLEAIAVERERRGPASGLADPDERFVWPDTEPSGESDGWKRKAASAPGLLAAAGYHVGATRGLSEPARKRILAEAWMGGDGEDVFDAAGWGVPSSGRRLRKLAYAIAGLARNAKARGNPALALAVAEWESDLEWMRITYYEGRFDFPWPGDSAPSHDGAFKP